MESNFAANLRRLVEPARAKAIALGITALIDGLWVRCALTPGGFDRETARRQVLDYLAQSIGGLSTGGARL